jgi:hypothetical protein
MIEYFFVEGVDLSRSMEQRLHVVLGLVTGK